MDVGDVKNIIILKANFFLRNVKPNNLALFQMNVLYFTYGIHIDAPQNSLKDSNVNPKAKITEKKELGYIS